MKFKITLARNWYEYQYSATEQPNGLFTLDCYCTDPDDYYCAHKSYTRRDVERDEINKIFRM